MASNDQILAKAADQFATATGGNDTISTASIAAPGAQSRNYIIGILVAFTGTPSTAPVITIKSGSTTLWTVTLPAVAAVAATPISIQFTRPLKCGVNEAATVTCGALGAGIASNVNIVGFRGDY